MFVEHYEDSRPGLQGCVWVGVGVNGMKSWI